MGANLGAPKIFYQFQKHLVLPPANKNSFLTRIMKFSLKPVKTAKLGCHISPGKHQVVIL